MTRKNFVAIAKAIKDSSSYDSKDELVSALLDELCRHFKSENELFDETKFRKACGV